MMGIPIKKLHVTDEEAKAIIRAALGNKLVGNLPKNWRCNEQNTV